MSKKLRTFIRHPDGTITLGCISCGENFDSSYFYVKYKDLPATQLSHWQEKCQKCVKTWRNNYYKNNSARLNAERKASYYANHDSERQKARGRSLARSLNPEKLKRRREVQKMDPVTLYFHRRCTHWKVQARKRKIEWGLDESWIQDLFNLQQGLCFYLKKPLELKPRHRNTVSIDRVDSKEGYTPDNVVLCGSLVNKMKLDLSLNEFAGVVADLHISLPSILARTGEAHAA